MIWNFGIGSNNQGNYDLLDTVREREFWFLLKYGQATLQAIEYH